MFSKYHTEKTVTTLIFYKAPETFWHAGLQVNCRAGACLTQEKTLKITSMSRSLTSKTIDSQRD